MQDAASPSILHQTRRGFGLRIALLFCLLAPVGLPGCRSDVEREPGPLRIAVSIAPLAGIVRRLAPPDAEITTLIDPRMSPHLYEPTPEDMMTVARADVTISVGAGLDSAIEALVKRRRDAAGTTVLFADAIGLDTGSHAGHSSHDGHDHGPVDPHLWLDPQLVARLIEPLADAIELACTRAGLPTTDLSSRRAQMIEDINALDAQLAATLDPVRDRAIVTHHAAFNRFAQRYGLRVVSVLRPIENSEPTPGQIAEALKAIQDQKVTAIFVEPQFNADAAERIARQAGVRLGVLDPIGDGDWFALLQSAAQTLAETLDQ